ncbi:hypothetical protein A5789_29145 [Nocardia sp. 852002-51101_SCH5132738]|uniref:hypothetical protein n=1 Tax=Nocardia sp. 852002-51101_SCH5132738 TaxID=1834095 RepID=UPI0007EA3F1F|nr:hypothetical protein [Nocardia sp. 852002-51101_SCH5132738]OBA50469.1 hypothetical protein A5789_29145 [Nocardia sp. 852002-51101_SCH5132738]
MTTSNTTEPSSGSRDLFDINPARRAVCRSVLWSLTQHADDAGKCCPGMDLLELETGLPEVTIAAAVELLAEHGVITVEESAAGDLFRVIAVGGDQAVRR